VNRQDLLKEVGTELERGRGLLYEPKSKGPFTKLTEQGERFSKSWGRGMVKCLR
jgi:hypothetical protein